MEADGRRELARVLLAVAVVVLAGVALGGVGFQNGDAAAYWAQVREGDPSDRVVHFGYFAVATLLAGQVDDLERALDLLSTAAAALAVLGVAASVRSGQGSPGIAALGAAAVMLPLSAHAEVDPMWIAAVVWSRALPAPLAGLAAAFATLVSPVALLALPWASRLERDRARWLVVGAGLAVLGISLWSGGAWWIGDRGVLTGGPPRPGRSLEAWSTALPWALLPLALLADRRQPAEVLTWAPLLLAPPDVPVWAIPGVALAARAASGAVLVPAAVASLAVALQVTIGGFSARALSERVADEDRLARQVATTLGSEGGLVAPFTWGARVAVRATGEPYGLLWRPPEGFLRDQRKHWCAARPGPVLALPPVDGIAVERDPAEHVLREGCGPESRTRGTGRP